MYKNSLVGLSVFLVMVTMVSGDCTQDMNNKLLKCQTDYTTSMAKADQNVKSTWCGPVSTWQACMKPYADQCSDNLIFKMLAPIQDQLKFVCSGAVSIQFTFMSLVALLVMSILLK